MKYTPIELLSNSIMTSFEEEQTKQNHCSSQNVFESIVNTKRNFNNFNFNSNNYYYCEMIFNLF